MVSSPFPWQCLEVPWVEGRTKAETQYRALHCAQGLQAAPLQGSGWAAVCPDASRVGKASSDHFRPNDIDGNENFVQLERLLKGFWRSESVFSVLFFIPCPSTRPDGHLCLLPPETETG